MKNIQSKFRAVPRVASAARRPVALCEGRKEGFTLIELIVVIVIIAVLTTMATIAFVSVRRQARDSTRMVHISQIQSALAAYHRDTGSYPADITPGEAFVLGNVTYMKQVPNNPQPAESPDPANNEYIYESLGGGQSYNVIFYLPTVINGLQGLQQATQSGIGSACTPANPLTVKVLVVAGGGGGGGDSYGGIGAGEGGGGAGGLIYNSAYQVSGTIGVTIGNGGVGGSADLPQAYHVGTNGQDSVFGSLTAKGGGGGGAGTTHGLAGGSGGGAGYNGTGGDADYISPRQGYDGGTGNSSGIPFAGHGGGGASEVGHTAPNLSTGGEGGAGLSYDISGASVTYSAGGRGSNGWTAGSGTAGTANTGNGGTGAGGGVGGTGGTGVVIVSYVTTDFCGHTVTGGTKTTSGANTIHTFTTSGNLVVAEN